MSSSFQPPLTRVSQNLGLKAHFAIEADAVEWLQQVTSWWLGQLHTAAVGSIPALSFFSFPQSTKIT